MSTSTTATCAIKELCETSRVLQQTFHELYECEALAAQLNALNQELKARVALLEKDVEFVTGERDVLKLLMTVTLAGGVPDPTKKKEPEFEEYVP